MSVITSSSSKKPEKLSILKTRSETFKFESKDWIKLNAGQPTMCRVLYPESMYPKLVEACRTKQLSTVDRVGVINDAYNLTKIGKLSPSTLLKVLTIAEKETEYAVWIALDTAIRGVFKALNSSGHEAKASKFRKFASDLIAPILSTVGWSPKSSDGHLGVMLRALIINLAGDICESDPKILLEASKRFNALCVSIANGGDGTCDALPSDLKSAVFKIVLRAGSKAEFEQVMKFWEITPTNAEKKIAYGSLGSIKDPALKKRVLEWARDDLKTQDFFYPMMSVQGSGPVGADVAWQFVQDNFEQLSKKIGLGSPALLYAVIACCSQGKSTKSRADEVEKFFLEKHKASVKRCRPKIVQMLERMRNMASFVETLVSGLDQW